MKDFFFDKTCSIYDTVIVNINSEDTKSYTPVYQSIDCDFYVPNNKFSKSNQARETELESLEVVLQWDKTLVRKGMKIQLTDSIGINYWNYIIDNIAIYKHINGTIDNITLKVTQRDVS